MNTMNEEEQYIYDPDEDGVEENKSFVVNLSTIQPDLSSLSQSHLFATLEALRSARRRGAQMKREKSIRQKEAVMGKPKRIGTGRVAKVREVEILPPEILGYEQPAISALSTISILITESPDGELPMVEIMAIIKPLPRKVGAWILKKLME